MLRVHVPEGPPRDFDANQVNVMGNGALYLAKVDVRVSSDHMDLTRQKMEVSNPQLVRVLAPGTWREVENLELDAPPLGDQPAAAGHDEARAPVSAWEESYR